MLVVDFQRLHRSLWLGRSFVAAAGHKLIVAGHRLIATTGHHKLVIRLSRRQR